MTTTVLCAWLLQRERRAASLTSPGSPSARHCTVCAVTVLVQAARAEAGLSMAALHAWLLP